LGILSDDNDEQSKKQKMPKDMTDFGIAIEDKDIQLEKQ
jgi:hypothetical protein